MELPNKKMDLLQLFTVPAFCVQNNTVIQINQAAAQRGIVENTPLSEMIPTECDAYEHYTGGYLYITLNINGIPCGVTVTRVEGIDVFLLEQEQPVLHTLALASQQLREPLANIMCAADDLFANDLLKADSRMQEQAAQINQGLFRMLRLLGNMSDAGKYQKRNLHQMKTCQIGAVFDEILSRVQELAAQANRTVSFTGLSQKVYCLADTEKLERGIYNLLSNAIKYSPVGSVISAKLTKNRNTLYFTVQDQGSGIAADLRGNMFSRYLREPGIEDGRNGVGLGMLLIKAAAAAHDGTVLIEQPEEGGTRVTMTLAIKQNTSNTLRSNIRSVDYAGEQDHSLIELSDILPSSSFEKIN